MTSDNEKFNLKKNLVRTVTSLEDADSEEQNFVNDYLYSLDNPENYLFLQEGLFNLYQKNLMFASSMPNKFNLKDNKEAYISKAQINPDAFIRLHANYLLPLTQEPSPELLDFLEENLHLPKNLVQKQLETHKNELLVQNTILPSLLKNIANFQLEYTSLSLKMSGVAEAKTANSLLDTSFGIYLKRKAKVICAPARQALIPGIIEQLSNLHYQIENEQEKQRQESKALAEYFPYREYIPFANFSQQFKILPAATFVTSYYKENKNKEELHNLFSQGYRRHELEFHPLDKYADLENLFTDFAFKENLSIDIPEDYPLSVGQFELEELETTYKQASFKYGKPTLYTQNINLLSSAFTYRQRYPFNAWQQMLPVFEMFNSWFSEALLYGMRYYASHELKHKINDYLTNIYALLDAGYSEAYNFVTTNDTQYIGDVLFGRQASYRISTPALIGQEDISGSLISQLQTDVHRFNIYLKSHLEFDFGYSPEETALLTSQFKNDGRHIVLREEINLQDHLWVNADIFKIHANLNQVFGPSISQFSRAIFNADLLKPDLTVYEQEDGETLRYNEEQYSHPELFDALYLYKRFAINSLGAVNWHRGFNSYQLNNVDLSYFKIDEIADIVHKHEQEFKEYLGARNHDLLGSTSNEIKVSQDNEVNARESIYFALSSYAGRMMYAIEEGTVEYEEYEAFADPMLPFPYQDYYQSWLGENAKLGTTYLESAINFDPNRMLKIYTLDKNCDISGQWIVEKVLYEEKGYTTAINDLESNYSFVNNLVFNGLDYTFSGFNFDVQRQLNILNNDVTREQSLDQYIFKSKENSILSSKFMASRFGNYLPTSIAKNTNLPYDKLYESLRRITKRGIIIQNQLARLPQALVYNFGDSFSLADNERLSQLPREQRFVSLNLMLNAKGKELEKWLVDQDLSQYNLEKVHKVQMQVDFYNQIPEQVEANHYYLVKDNYNDSFSIIYFAQEADKIGDLEVNYFVQHKFDLNHNLNVSQYSNLVGQEKYPVKVTREQILQSKFGAEFASLDYDLQKLVEQKFSSIPGLFATLAQYGEADYSLTTAGVNLNWYTQPISYDFTQGVTASMVHPVAGRGYYVARNPVTSELEITSPLLDVDQQQEFTLTWDNLFSSGLEPEFASKITNTIAFANLDDFFATYQVIGSIDQVAIIPESFEETILRTRSDMNLSFDKYDFTLLGKQALFTHLYENDLVTYSNSQRQIKLTTLFENLEYNLDSDYPFATEEEYLSEVIPPNALPEIKAGIKNLQQEVDKEVRGEEFQPALNSEPPLERISGQPPKVVFTKEGYSYPKNDEYKESKYPRINEEDIDEY